MSLFNIEKSYLRRKSLGDRKWYWAVDLHDTIFYSNYEVASSGGAYFPGAKNILQLLTNNSEIILILFTACTPDALEHARKRFDKDAIVFDYVNENPEVIHELSDFSQKFYFDVLLEDKAGFDGEKDWFHVEREYKMILKTFKNLTK